MSDTGPQPELPPHVHARLQVLYRADLGPSAATRRALVELAGAQVAARRRMRVWRAMGVAAAIALVGAAAAIWAPWRSSVPTAAVMAALDPMDLNADGVVDMLDALAARRSLDAGGTVSVAGATGQEAVSAIAQRAVRLPVRPQDAGGNA